MSATAQLYIAQTQGTSFTMYAVMRSMGIPLTERQQQVQGYLESRYPAIVKDTEDIN